MYIFVKSAFKNMICELGIGITNSMFGLALIAFLEKNSSCVAIRTYVLYLCTYGGGELAQLVRAWGIDHGDMGMNPDHGYNI